MYLFAKKLQNHKSNIIHLNLLCYVLMPQITFYFIRKCTKLKRNKDTFKEHTKCYNTIWFDYFASYHCLILAYACVRVTNQCFGLFLDACCCHVQLTELCLEHLR